jgi:quinol monooxygenase YgiN
VWSLPGGTAIVIRQVKYLNNIVEQDCRAVKRVIWPMLGCKTFQAAQCTIAGVELMHMLKKRQWISEVGEEPLTAAYVLTHADAIPPAKDTALVLLQQLAETSRQEAGSVRFEVLQQSSRLNHCTVVEIWRDEQALAAHAMAAHTRQFRDAFQPMSGSLYDERLYRALD